MPGDVAETSSLPAAVSSAIDVTQLSRSYLHIHNSCDGIEADRAICIKRASTSRARTGNFQRGLLMAVWRFLASKRIHYSRLLHRITSSSKAQVCSEPHHVLRTLPVFLATHDMCFHNVHVP
jgi:hypothetical protein